MVTLQVPPAPLLLLDTVLTEQSCGYSQNPSNQARAVSSPLLSRPGVTMFCIEMPAENSELGQASWVQRVQGAGLRGDPLARSHACPVRILRRGRPCAALRLTGGRLRPCGVSDPTEGGQQPAHKHCSRGRLHVGWGQREMGVGVAVRRWVVRTPGRDGRLRELGSGVLWDPL